ncbi:MAG: hypothetical protein KDC54_25260, partial [Lewinella sp.]|nr:hypothetical protein [Lewinella sp.]
MGKRLLSLLILALCLGLSQPLAAQKAKLRRAALMMEALQYDEAIDLYERVIDKDEQSAEAIRGLAE